MRSAGSGRKNYSTLVEVLQQARDSMEYLRSLKITIEIDTNKATYREDFTDWRKALQWLRRLGFDLGILE